MPSERDKAIENPYKSPTEHDPLTSRKVVAGRIKLSFNLLAAFFLSTVFAFVGLVVWVPSLLVLSLCGTVVAVLAGLACLLFARNAGNSSWRGENTIALLLMISALVVAVLAEVILI